MANSGKSKGQMKNQKKKASAGKLMTESEIRDKMTKLYKANNGFGGAGDKTLDPNNEISKARDQWYKLQSQANKLREAREKRELKQAEYERNRPRTAEEQRKIKEDEGYRKMVSTAQERFAKVTSASWKRYQKRLDRSVRRNLGN